MCQCKCNLSVLAMASVFLGAGSAWAQFAAEVVSYSPGSLPSSLVDYTNATSALGEPARVTPGPFGGPVDPFSPAYLNSQLTSLGTNGSLTVRLGAPIVNDPFHPFGQDFMIFGNAGFIITNGDFGGGGITDGSLFGHNAGASRVSVSADNVTWYTLDPTLAPGVDGLYPTDGAGNFFVPVNPALAGRDFAGLTLAEIRALYQGSAGGTGFDLSWARNDAGQPVNVPSVNFVRIEVLDGHAEIDGLVVVPEPATWILVGVGLVMCAVARWGPHQVRS
jgi:hypothetical protein